MVDDEGGGMQDLNEVELEALVFAAVSRAAPAAVTDRQMEALFRWGNDLADGSRKAVVEGRLQPRWSGEQWELVDVPEGPVGVQFREDLARLLAPRVPQEEV